MVTIHIYILSRMQVAPDFQQKNKQPFRISHVGML